MAIGRHKWLILTALVLVPGVFALRIFGEQWPLLAGGIAAALVLLALLFATLDWPSHDEAAQAAMKDAWFWGTSIGVAVVGVGLVLLRAARDAGTVVLFSPSDRLDYVALGILATLLCQGVCSVLAWIAWWATKR